jgi:hypothetical protein
LEEEHQRLLKNEESKEGKDAKKRGVLTASLSRIPTISEENFPAIPTSQAPASSLEDKVSGIKALLFFHRQRPTHCRFSFLFSVFLGNFQATEALIKPLRQGQTAAASGLTRGNTFLRISEMAKSAGQAGSQVTAADEDEKSHVWKEIKRLQGHGGQAPPPEVREETMPIEREIRDICTLHVHMCVAVAEYR